MAHLCHHCGSEWTGDPKVGRGDTCRKCGSSLHVCLNCRFHDATKHNQCAEPAAEWVRDKAKANFCIYFEFAKDGGASDRETERKKKVEDQLKNLFND